MSILTIYGQEGGSQAPPLCCYSLFTVIMLLRRQRNDFERHAEREIFPIIGGRAIPTTKILVTSLYSLIPFYERFQTDSVSFVYSKAIQFKPDGNGTFIGNCRQRQLICSNNVSQKQGRMQTKISEGIH